MFPRPTPHQLALTMRHAVRATAEEPPYSFLGRVRADCIGFFINCVSLMDVLRLRVRLEVRTCSIGAARSRVRLSRRRFSRFSTHITYLWKGKEHVLVAQVHPNPNAIRKSREYFLKSPHRWMVPVLLPKSRAVELVWVDIKVAMRLRWNGYYGVTWGERRGGGTGKPVVFYVAFRT